MLETTKANNKEAIDKRKGGESFTLEMQRNDNYKHKC